MSTARIGVTLERDVLSELDERIRRGVFPNRSKAIELALQAQLRRGWRQRDPKRLDRECRKLDPCEEKAMADEGLAADVAQWPEY